MSYKITRLARQIMEIKEGEKHKNQTKTKTKNQKKKKPPRKTNCWVLPCHCWLYS